MTLLKATGIYIRSKRKHVLCQQKHFKQLCHTCKKYANCNVYNNYVRSWMALQQVYKRECRRIKGRK